MPDLAIIRVGDTYYMSSTTMHMSPGLPIMKSKDLVNWQLVGYAYDTLEDNGRTFAPEREERLRKRLLGQQPATTTTARSTSRPSPAPPARPTSTRPRTPRSGPWEATSFRPALHDHSLFFDDDGRVYMIHGGGRHPADRADRRPLGDQARRRRPGHHPERQRRRRATRSACRPRARRSRKINGKYYLFNITWPRGGMRTQLIFRADKLTGPYEGRVALQDQGVAQGGLIDTPEGDWYALLFQDHGAVGRIPFLVPVTWEDGWPVLGVDGKVPTKLEPPGKHPGRPAASSPPTNSTGPPAIPRSRWSGSGTTTRTTSTGRSPSVLGSCG